MNINKFFFGVAAGIVIAKVLPETKSYLKPAAVQFLGKAMAIKDEALEFCSSINEEALENRNEKRNEIINKAFEDK